MWHYVYVITNNINGKRYVGKHSTNNLDDGYMGSSVILRRSQKKYGIENFTKRIVKFFETDDEAYVYEERYITKVNAVKNKEFYNLSGGGKGSGSGENSPNYGRIFSEEHKRKISDANRGKRLSEETRARISESSKGRKHSEEARRKMSDANKGRTFTSEHRKKLGDSRKGENNHNYGKTFSEEHKRKISDANKGKIVNKNTRSKLSESNGMPVRVTFPSGTYHIFTSKKAVAKHFVIGEATVDRIIKSGKPYEAGKCRNQKQIRFDLIGITIEELPKGIHREHTLK